VIIRPRLFLIPLDTIRMDRPAAHAMRHHPFVQAADRVAAPGQAHPREKTVHETAERAGQHAAAEAEGPAHVLEVGFVDRGGG